MLKSLQDPVQAHSAEDITIALETIHQHLYEKHHLDRVVHALYLHPDGGIGLTKHELPKPNSGTNVFTNRIRVQFPRPAELPRAIKETKESAEDLSLLYLLLMEPLLRYRLCMTAHLLEAAFAVTNGCWDDSECPRQLSSDEMAFVMQRLQYTFLELFNEPVTQASLRRFFTIVYEWTVDQITRPQPKSDEEVGPAFPKIVKEIFPCCDIIFREYCNIVETGRHDLTFNSEVHMLFKFVMLSLKHSRFTSASDWMSEGQNVIENLQQTLKNGRYRGPAQRLFRNVVSMTDHLWEGGSSTDTSLAIEKCLHTVIVKTLRSADHASAPGVGVDVGGAWDVMDDFERLLRVANNGVEVLPLPCITWTRSHSEICLDGTLVQFSHLLPSHIHMNSTMEFDRHENKLCRQWHLHISGLELEADRVPYYYITKSRTRRHLTDVGELSLSIPPESLDIDIKFILHPPEIRHGATAALHRLQDQPSKSHPTALVPNVPEQESTRRQSALSRTSINGQSQPRALSERRRSEHSIQAVELARTGARTGVRIGQEITRLVAEDARTAFTVISQVLYPNRRNSRGLNLPTHRVEQTRSQWMPSEDRIFWGRRSRHQFFQSVSPASLRDYHRDFRDDIEERERERQNVSSPPRPEGVATGSQYGSEYGFSGSDRSPTFVDMKECKIRLRKVNVKVHETKRPILHTLMHAILVYQLRKALEQTLRQAVVEVVSAINRGVEEVMEFSHEELHSRHSAVGGGQERQAGVERAREDQTRSSRSVPQQHPQEQQRFPSPQRQMEVAKQDTGIFAAFPLFSTVI
ncbi:hypothetical protein BGZ98_002861 [Dissophora globulifera]|nr:hypothetical protein BGZ98_002861 [Dissophora globulifera]